MIRTEDFQKVVRARVKEIAEEEIQNCIKEIERRVANELNGMVMQFMEMVDYSCNEKEIVFKIKPKEMK